jgi:hypothetical protein
MKRPPFWSKFSCEHVHRLVLNTLRKCFSQMLVSNNRPTQWSPLIGLNAFDIAPWSQTWGVGWEATQWRWPELPVTSLH